MAYSLVTATDFADLLGELELFAEAQGWTVPWNSGTQIGLNSGNCYAAFGVDGQTNPAVETDTYPDPDVNVSDFRAYGSLGKNFSVSGAYYGLSGSPVTTAVDNDRVMLNDLTGPFSEVHFFGSDRYIWVVIRSDADRWTHFGFGVLDKMGMTHPDCAFMAGIFWRWWDNADAGGFQIKRNLDYTQNDFPNKIWMKEGGINSNNYQVYLPDAVLDPGFGIADDVISRTGLTNLVVLRPQGKATSGFSDYSEVRLMSHWPWAKVKPVTGGLPLLSVPVMFGQGPSVTDSLITYLGDFPGVRLCDISNVPIGEDIVYGSETYLAFPLKRRTSTTYDGKASTYGFGVAFKKD